MTGISPFVAGLGGIVLAAGLTLFVDTLVAVRRGTRSANLEYGYPPAVVAAVGLGLADRGVGWPGWPVPACLLAGFALFVLFALVIVAAGRRRRNRRCHSQCAIPGKRGRGSRRRSAAGRRCDQAGAADRARDLRPARPFYSARPTYWSSPGQVRLWPKADMHAT